MIWVGILVKGIFRLLNLLVFVFSLFFIQYFILSIYFITLFSLSVILGYIFKGYIFICRFNFSLHTISLQVLTVLFVPFHYLYLLFMFLFVSLSRTSSALLNKSDDIGHLHSVTFSDRKH